MSVKLRWMWCALAAGFAAAVLSVAAQEAAPSCSGAQAPASCERVLPGRRPFITIPAKKGVLPEEGKVAFAIREAAMAVAAAAREGRDPHTLSTPLLRVRSSGDIDVYVLLDQYHPDKVNRLAAEGLEVRNVLPQYRLVQAWLPAHALSRVAKLDFVVEVRRPGYPITNAGAQLTTGDSILNAASARSTYGLSGNGITVGVMSDGVDHLQNSTWTGDLPSVVQVARAGSGDEGTAMLEIVHDLAPGAGLLFYSPYSSADMVSEIGYLGASSVRVIVDDLTFLDEPKFEDGPIAQAARNFATNGRIYVTSAGNAARNHYRAPYNRLAGQAYPDASYPALHNYASSGTDIGNTFTIPTNCTVTVVLQWNNPLNGGPHDDFDLFLSDSATGNILAYSVNDQAYFLSPFEALSYTNNGKEPQTAYIAIAEYYLSSPASSIILDYFTYERCGIGSSGGFQYVTSADSVIGHAAVNEVLSVAALPSGSPSSIESYSSRGPGSISFPAPETRSVPNISGIDCVATQAGALGYFANPFCGTSAAAPHIAGIVALLMEQNPSLTSAEYRNLITGGALDLGAAGFDYAFGYGRANALASANLEAPGDHTPPSVPTGLTASAVAPNQVNLAWSASTDNVGVTGYKVFRDTFFLEAVTGANATSYVDGGAWHSTTYTYTVSACDAIGNCSAQSPGVSVTTPPDPEVLSVVSRKTHGGAGTFDIPIGTQVLAVEPRAMGVAGHQIVFTFDHTITSIESYLLQDTQRNNVGSVSASFSGNTVTMVLTGLPDSKSVYVTVRVNRSRLNHQVPIGFLTGDVDGTGLVSSPDLSLARNIAGMTIDGTNFLRDVNASGFVGASDILIIKGRQGLSLPP
jgi:hypothetical protein